MANNAATTYDSLSQHDDAGTGAGGATSTTRASSPPMMNHGSKGNRTVHVDPDEAELDAILGDVLPASHGGGGIWSAREVGGTHIVDQRPCHRRCCSSFMHRQTRQVMPILAASLAVVPLLCALILFVAAAIGATTVSSSLTSGGGSEWSITQMLTAGGIGVVFGVQFVLVIELPVVELLMLAHVCWRHMDADVDERATDSIDLAAWWSTCARCG